MGILIYQMGRVGSVAINRALKDAGVKTFHAHYLVNSGEHYKRNLDNKTLNEIKHYDIVTLVRDPIERNLSEYFRRIQNTKPNKYDYTALYKGFMKDYNQVWPLIWFDLEFKNWTGLDVLNMKEYFYPYSTNYYELSDGRVALILRTDKLNSPQASAALSDLSAKDVKEIPMANSTHSLTGIGTLYKKFLDEACFPKSFIDFFYNSRYATTFFSHNELDVLRGRWSCPF